jgi:MarR family transcriptional regulator for hemolysin
METIKQVLFYELEKAIKTYRQFAQGRLKKMGFDITIDQWLVLNTITENPSITQGQIGQRVFKDKASVTRIIELLVKNEYLKRKADPENRRKVILLVTRKGKQLINKIYPVVIGYRKDAIRGISLEQVSQIQQMLYVMIHNCNKKAQD